MGELRTGALTVCAVTAAPRFLDRAGSVTLAAQLVRRAASEGARFVVFPEAFVPGFPYWINLTAAVHHRPWQRRLWEQAVDAADPDHLAPLVRAAAETDAVVVLGCSERDGGTLYNAQVVIDGTSGVVEVRRKLVPTFMERAVWGYGDGSTLRALPTRVGAVGALMCWEHALNLARQKLIIDGAQLHAAAWPGFEGVSGIEDGYRGRVELLTRHHALTGQCIVVSAMSPLSDEIAAAMRGLPGAEELVRPGPGWSAVVLPTGEVAADLVSTVDDLLLAEVDLGACVDAKLLLDPAGHSGRAEILRLVVDTTPIRPSGS
jgi:nitrilase